MTDLISELLAKASQSLNKKIGNELRYPIAKGAFTGIIIAIVSTFMGNIMIPDFASWESLELVKYYFMTIVTYLLISLPIVLIKDYRLDKVLEDVEEKQHELCEAVLFEPSLNKTLEEQRINDGLAAVASIDISKLSLEELKQVIGYIGDFIPQTEDELKEELLVRGYKPSKSLTNEAVNKSYNL